MEKSRIGKDQKQAKMKKMKMKKNQTNIFCLLFALRPKFESLKLKNFDAGEMRKKET